MQLKGLSISVVVPTYNNEGQIFECLKSLLEQGDNIFEIIVVNDGSTDKTEDIVKSINDKSKKIKLISVPNHGVSHARNLGVSEAKGDYIAFVDADDYLKRDAVGVIKKELIKNDYPDFLRYNFEEFGGKRFSNNLFGLDRGLLIIKDNLADINKHLLSTKESIPNLCQLLVIKTGIAKSIKFDDEIIYLEDQLYYQKLLKKARNCLFLNYRGYMLRTTSNSSSMAPARAINNIESLFKVNSLLHEMNVVGEEIIDDTHFRLMLGKMAQLAHSDVNSLRKYMKEENVERFVALYDKSQNKKNGPLKLIAKSILKKHFCFAILLIRVRSRISEMRRVFV